MSSYNDLILTLADEIAELSPLVVRRIELDADDSAIYSANVERIEKVGCKAPLGQLAIDGERYAVTLNRETTRLVTWDDEEMLKVLSAQLWTP